MEPDSVDASSPEKLHPAWLWPAIIIGALGLHATVWILFTLIAVRDPSFAVEPDHYRKSLAWDETAAERRRSQALGWKLSVETGEETTLYGDRRLVCRLVDRSDQPVDGATVDVEVFHHARGNERPRATLTEEGGGIYSGSLRMRKPGLWECRFAVLRGDVTFHEVLYHTVSGKGGRSR